MVLEEYKKYIKGKKVCVLGVGVSNLPLIDFLKNAGANVVARDKNEKIKLDGVKMVLGKHYLEDIDEEIIFKSPGIRFDIPELIKAREKGSVITSEMEVFFELCPCDIIAVTGSDGKTTTTTIIYELLKKEGYTCHLGGNIGRPLIGDLDIIKEADKVVLELSSFQLHTMKKSPKIAVITNLSPNHLDWHKGMDEYLDAKKNIYRYGNERLVLNKDNAITAGLSCEAVMFSRQEKLEKGVCVVLDKIYYNNSFVLSVSDIKLRGVHNIENYMAAIGAVGDLVSADTISAVAKSFGGVKHRMEFVREKDGVKFYNDSIGSSPTRTMATLSAFDEKLILIAGGYDKKLPFDELGKFIHKKVKKLVLVGATSAKIKEATLVNGDFPIYECQGFEEAIKTAFELAKSGDIVILSPACASFDMFENFEVRGNKFKEIVERL